MTPPSRSRRPAERQLRNGSTPAPAERQLRNGSTPAPIKRQPPRAPAKPRPSRILLVDEHPIVREWLAAVIARESDLAVCGSASDLKTALTLVARFRPDLVIVDLVLKDTRGANAAAVLRASFEHLAILIFSRLADDAHAEIAIRSGARGFVNHRASGAQVQEAIRRVLNGGVCFDAQAAERILGHVADGRKACGQAPDQALSTRELCVFELLGDGYRPGEIAGKMSISVSTVEGYMARIEVKLGIPTSRDLVRVAIAWLRARTRE